MKKISEKLRIFLRRVFVIFGIVAVPYAAHAGYGMRDEGPFNTDIHGTVRSLETGESISGISVNVTRQGLYSRYETTTDNEGHFSLLLPERENYNIHFEDEDGELNGGLFRHQTKTVTLNDTNDAINIGLEGENVVTIRGVVLSEKNKETISGIRLLINITESDIEYKVWTDDNGSFLIRVPERDRYSIVFEDINRSLFKGKTEDFIPSDINDYLSILLEEEKIITLRGITRSAKTGKILDHIEVQFSSDTGISAHDKRLVFERRHKVLTNYEGYFEIRIPEREEYIIYFHDTQRNLSISDRLKIALPYNGVTLNIDVQER